MTSYDIVIKDGMIFDGTGAPRVRGDIGVANGRVAAIGRVDARDGARVIDANGLHVAPGVVDLHTHYDSQIFWDPYCTISGWHGVTSVAIGNCGFGFAPVRPELREYAMRSMTRVEAIPYESMRAGMPWDWVTFPEYLNSLERTPKAVNVLPFVPLGPMLVDVLGLEGAKSGRLPTDQDHATLLSMLAEALDAGGCGWSAQRLPPSGPAAVQRDWDGGPMPTDMMNNDTALLLAGALAARNTGVIQMTLTSGDNRADRSHLEQLASRAGRPILYNVVQAFDSEPHIHRSLIGWLERCRERGIPVYGQGMTTDAGFTFTLEHWNLFDDSPAWLDACMGDKAERLAKFSDPSRREALRNNLPRTATAPIETITVLSPRSPRTERFREMTLAHIAKVTGQHVVDAMLDIAVEDGLDTLFFVAPPQGDSDLLKEIVQYPHMLFGVSDGGAHTKFLTAGRYPTETLTDHVRKNQWITYEEAHRRLSALPAQLAGFSRRGQLAVDSPADVIVYDPEGLTTSPSRVLHDQPAGEWRRVQDAEGYRAVLVNGAVTIENDQLTNTFSGSLLRHGG